MINFKTSDGHSGHGLGENKARGAAKNFGPGIEVLLTIVFLFVIYLFFTISCEPG